MLRCLWSQFSILINTCLCVPALKDFCGVLICLVKFKKFKCNFVLNYLIKLPLSCDTSKQDKFTPFSLFGMVQYLLYLFSMPAFLPPAVMNLCHETCVEQVLFIYCFIQKKFFFNLRKSILPFNVVWSYHILMEERG